MIDETKPKIPCWLTWSTTVDGLVTLESICLTNWIAVQHKKMLQDERIKRFISVKIEPAEANHLFAADLDEKWMAEYGQEAFKRNESAIVDILVKERNDLRIIVKELRSGIKEYITTGKDKNLRSAMQMSWEYDR